MRLLLALALVLTTPSLARADGEIQDWSALFMQYRPTPGGIAGWFDGQLRRGSTSIMILRPGIGWGIGEHLTLHAGYGYIHTFVDNADDKHEHRLWQQGLYVRPLNHDVLIQARVRLEQRFIDGDDSTGHRIRFLGYLRYGASPVPLQLVISNELFISLNGTAKIASGFNQNRAFFGLGADTKVKGLRVEGGYMNVKFGDNKNPMDRTNDAMDHVILMQAIAVIK